MTVQELIDALSRMCPTAPVMVNGYEAGVDEINRVESKKFRGNKNHYWGEGQHELTKWDEPEEAGEPCVHLWCDRG